MQAREVVLALLGSLGLIASIDAGPIRMPGDAARDTRQTLQARRVLTEDPELASVNIGVFVQNRVATLWGPVPSAEIAFRAELCLKTMIELVEIRNQLFVSESLEPNRRPLKIDVPPSYLPELLPPQLPKAPPPKVQAPDVHVGQVKPPKYAPSQTTSQPKMIPIATPPPSGKQAAGDNVELSNAVRTLLDSNPTYRGVQFAIKGRHVYLKADETSDGLHDAARAISRLPGVEGVILLDKKSLP